jgi:hypothetical protein
MPGVGILDSLKVSSRESVGMPQKASKGRVSLLTPTTQLAQLKFIAISIYELLGEISL